MPWTCPGNPGWDELAVPIAVDVFDCDESIKLLRSWIPGRFPAGEFVESPSGALAGLPLVGGLALHRGLGITGVAGFFAAGEIGPVAGRNHLPGFTASVLAFAAAEPGESS